LQAGELRDCREARILIMRQPRASPPVAQPISSLTTRGRLLARSRLLLGCERPAGNYMLLVSIHDQPLPLPFGPKIFSVTIRLASASARAPPAATRSKRSAMTFAPQARVATLLGQTISMDRPLLPLSYRWARKDIPCRYAALNRVGFRRLVVDPKAFAPVRALGGGFRRLA
jgi:hypothetical protein